MILIPKPNKKRLRPISLASRVGTQLEKLIIKRLERFIELEGLFSIPNLAFIRVILATIT